MASCAQWFRVFNQYCNFYLNSLNYKTYHTVASKKPLKPKTDILISVSWNYLNSFKRQMSSRANGMSSCDHKLGFFNQYWNTYLITWDYKNTKLAQIGVRKECQMHSIRTQPIFNQCCLKLVNLTIIYMSSKCHVLLKQMGWSHVLSDFGILNQYCNTYLNTLDSKNVQTIF